MARGEMETASMENGDGQPRTDAEPAGRRGPGRGAVLSVVALLVVAAFALYLQNIDRLRGRRPESVRHVDVAPTILHALGIELDPRYRGRDLLSLAYTEDEAVAFLDDGSETLSGSIVDDGFKLIRYAAPAREELFDLTNDPQELRDLAADPSYDARRRGLAARLRRRELGG